jgi:anti-sigma factor RsiW
MGASTMRMPRTACGAASGPSGRARCVLTSRHQWDAAVVGCCGRGMLGSWDAAVAAKQLVLSKRGRLLSLFTDMQLLM